MDNYAILCDFQAPYHNESAVEVACQICEDLKPLTLVLNGDIVDFHTIGRWPSRPNAQVLGDFAEELERARSLTARLIRRIKPRQCHWNDGNHEWRLQRLFMRDSQMVRVLGEKKIADATSIKTLLDLDKLKIRYTGEYPKGFWLKDPAACPEDRNCYCEHGYVTRQKAGYTASAMVDTRMTNSIVGHVERLGVVWKKAVGFREFFGAEGGCFSKLGLPGSDNIYDGVPFKEADFMNKHIGFLIVRYEGGFWFPEAVKIRHDKKGRALAVWGNRVYRG